MSCSQPHIVLSACLDTREEVSCVLSLSLPVAHPFLPLFLRVALSLSLACSLSRCLPLFLYLSLARSLSLSRRSLSRSPSFLSPDLSPALGNLKQGGSDIIFLVKADRGVSGSNRYSDAIRIIWYSGKVYILIKCLFNCRRYILHYFPL